MMVELLTPDDGERFLRSVVLRDQRSMSAAVAAKASETEGGTHRLMLMSLPSMALASSSGRTELEMWCDVTVPLLSDLCEMLMSRAECECAPAAGRALARWATERRERRATRVEWSCMAKVGVGGRSRR